MRLDSLTAPEKLAAGSMIVVAVAAFLPWVSLLGFGVAGIEGDGKITLGVALAGLVALVVGTSVLGSPRLPAKAYYAISCAGAAITVLVAAADMNNFAAIGLYLTLFGGIAWVAALVWDRREKKKRLAVGEEVQGEGSPDAP